MIPAAQALFRGARQPLLPAFELVYIKLVDERGCIPVVKTICATFALHGELVVAVHPNTGYFEVALPNLPGIADATYDAAHLKWKALPRGYQVTGEGDLPGLMPMLEMAVEAVRGTGMKSTSTHTVTTLMAA